MGKQMADIDGKKLRVLLDSWCAENNTSIYKLSEQLGYSQTWLWDVTKHSRIRKTGIKMLNDFCGIEYADYKLTPKQEIKEETEVVEEETTDLKEIAAALNKIAAIQEHNAELLETLITMLK